MPTNQPSNEAIEAILSSFELFIRQRDGVIPAPDFSDAQNGKDQAHQAITTLLVEARIDELAQNFLDTDETCMQDVITKQSITVKQRKAYLYERLEEK